MFPSHDLNLIDSATGDQGEDKIPIDNSTVEIQSYKGSSETGSFIEGNKLGYLVSDTLYDENNYADLLAAANFPASSLVELASGDQINKVDFTLLRPSQEQYLYLIWDYRNESLAINRDTKIRIYFDSSGSMDSTLAPLQTMRDTILKDRLLPLYDNDSDLYDQSVTVLENSSERTIDMLNMSGDTPEGNVIVLVFQDEADTVYHNTPYTGVLKAQYSTDLAALRGRLLTFEPSYYRGVIFQVENPSVGDAFKNLIQDVQNGVGNYVGTNGLSDRNEFNYKYDITDGGTPQYYLDQIVNALTELGYEL